MEHLRLAIKTRDKLQRIGKQQRKETNIQTSVGNVSSLHSKTMALSFPRNPISISNPAQNVFLVAP